MKKPINIFWFRRDLRMDDNAGLFHALRSGLPVLPIFIFDTHILSRLEDKKDRRVMFIHEALRKLQSELITHGSSLYVMHGTPEEAFTILTNRYTIHEVYCNHDYEPYGIHRDQLIESYLLKKGIGFRHFKDQVIMEKTEVVKDDGKAYTVFTPYSRKWKSLLTDEHLASYPTLANVKGLLQLEPFPFPELKDIGFETSDKHFPSAEADTELIRHYSKQRDIPGIRGTSRLGVHLRFGTISIRKLARVANGLSETYLNELIWRDFYHMILWNFPQVGQDKAFKPAYDRIEWRIDPEGFERWCNGQTGYPIVDAGMRELNQTGFMHNRIRMVTASFLCKHLLIDWRLGEAYFAEKLLDFDFAANNGGWQWASGSGCDAAPYFRIFNPYLQTKKFDPDFSYIRKWVPEFQEFTYPKPLVEHEYARKRCLEVYSKSLNDK